MSDQFVGCTVSVKCIQEYGTFQGQITDLTKEYVLLAQPFCNGVPYGASMVCLSAKNIISVEIISTKEEEFCVNDVAQAPNKVTVKRPIAKRAGRSVSETIPTSLQSTSSQTQLYSVKTENAQPCMEQTINGKLPPGVLAAPEAIVKPGQKKLTQKQKNMSKDAHTFGTPIDQLLQQDFDFEKNLALFDKEALRQELNSLKPHIVRQSEGGQRGSNARYRHDENIIVGEPAVFNQITVPVAGEKEYVTDNGLVIPSLPLSLHRQLIGAADRFGISWERRVELLGRAGAEIVLQLLGGGHRLNPNNAHQWPTIVALCGPHRSGAAGVNCARQLSSHGVKTIVFVENSEDIFLLQELSLYRLTENKVETKIKNLPPGVDLIILALCDENSPKSVTPTAKWANSNKAPILAIEPPSTGTPGIVSKLSLLGGLPLSHSLDNGRLYLCNLALPSRVYEDVGITYRSPFGPKFVIPLHSNNS